jgi:hypothetical protein
VEGGEPIDAQGEDLVFVAHQIPQRRFGAGAYTSHMYSKSNNFFARPRALTISNGARNVTSSSVVDSFGFQLLGIFPFSSDSAADIFPKVR